MADPHFSRDHVWLVVSSPASFNIDFAKVKTLGITGLYYANTVTLAQLATARSAMPKVGLIEFADTTNVLKAPEAVAMRAHNDLTLLAANDGGQTPVLLDFEPSHGSASWWGRFLWGAPGDDQDPGSGTRGWRGSRGKNDGTGYRPGRVTDFTPEPFKATELPVKDLLDARFDVKVQDYFGGMELVDAWEAGLDWVTGLNGFGFPPERIRSFVDGGRNNKPPVFYDGRVVRRLLGGSCIWNANLMREAGLI